MSSACLLHSVLLATDLRTPGGAIPARTCRLSTFIGLRQPVMHLQLSLREASTFFAWDDLSHTGQAYSATEKQSARAVASRVKELAPHDEFASLWRRLFLVLTSPFTFSMCCL